MIRILSWRLARRERSYLRTLDRAYSKFDRTQNLRARLADRVAAARAHAALDKRSHTA